jgi:hypothetical protein
LVAIYWAALAIIGACVALSPRSTQMTPTFKMHRIFFPTEDEVRAVVLITLPDEEDREIGINVEVTIESALNLTIEEVKARAFDLAKQAMAAASD